MAIAITAEIKLEITIGIHRNHNRIVNRNNNRNRDRDHNRNKTRHNNWNLLESQPNW